MNNVMDFEGMRHPAGYRIYHLLGGCMHCIYDCGGQDDKGKEVEECYL